MSGAERIRRWREAHSKPAKKPPPAAADTIALEAETENLKKENIELRARVAEMEPRQPPAGGDEGIAALIERIGLVTRGPTDATPAMMPHSKRVEVMCELMDRVSVDHDDLYRAYEQRLMERGDLIHLSLSSRPARASSIPRGRRPEISPRAAAEASAAVAQLEARVLELEAALAHEKYEHGAAVRMYQRAVDSREGVLTADEYRKIMACLHPDNFKTEQQKRRFHEASVIINEHKKHLVKKRYRAAMPDLDDGPQEPEMTRADWDAMASKVKADRKAKRAANKKAKAGAAVVAPRRIR
jgi:hypothetical protein